MNKWNNKYEFVSSSVDDIGPRARAVKLSSSSQRRSPDALARFEPTILYFVACVLRVDHLSVLSVSYYNYLRRRRRRHCVVIICSVTRREYLDNIRLVDEGVKDIVGLFEGTFNDNRTAYVFTADHGMTDWGMSTHYSPPPPTPPSSGGSTTFKIASWQTVVRFWPSQLFCTWT